MIVVISFPNVVEGFFACETDELLVPRTLPPVVSLRARSCVPNRREASLGERLLALSWRMSTDRVERDASFTLRFTFGASEERDEGVEFL